MACEDNPLESFIVTDSVPNNLTISNGDTIKFLVDNNEDLVTKIATVGTDTVATSITPTGGTASDATPADAYHIVHNGSTTEWKKILSGVAGNLLSLHPTDRGLYVDSSDLFPDFLFIVKEYDSITNFPVEAGESLTFRSSGGTIGIDVSTGPIVDLDVNISGANGNILEDNSGLYVPELVETITELSVSAGVFTYKDEEGQENDINYKAINIPATDTENILGGGPSSNIQALIDKLALDYTGNDVLTSLSLNLGVLTYTDEEGTDTDIDLTDIPSTSLQKTNGLGIDLTLTGTGTAGSPYDIQADLNATINDLTDVTITSPTNGQVLTYSGGQWVNQAVSGGSGSNSFVSFVSLVENSGVWSLSFTGQNGAFNDSVLLTPLTDSFSDNYISAISFNSGSNELEFTAVGLAHSAVVPLGSLATSYDWDLSAGISAAATIANGDLVNVNVDATLADVMTFSMAGKNVVLSADSATIDYIMKWNGSKAVWAANTASGMTSFNIEVDGAGTIGITNGDTIDFIAGTGIDLTIGGVDPDHSVTVALDATLQELSNVSAGSNGQYLTWTGGNPAWAPIPTGNTPEFRVAYVNGIGGTPALDDSGNPYASIKDALSAFASDGCAVGHIVVQGNVDDTLLTSWVIPATLKELSIVSKSKTGKLFVNATEALVVLPGMASELEQGLQKFNLVWQGPVDTNDDLLITNAGEMSLSEVSIYLGAVTFINSGSTNEILSLSGVHGEVSLSVGAVTGTQGAKIIDQGDDCSGNWTIDLRGDVTLTTPQDGEEFIKLGAGSVDMKVSGTGKLITSGLAAAGDTFAFVRSISSSASSIEIDTDFSLVSSTSDIRSFIEWGGDGDVTYSGTVTDDSAQGCKAFLLSTSEGPSTYILENADLLGLDQSNSRAILDITPSTGGERQRVYFKNVFHQDRLVRVNTSAQEIDIFIDDVYSLIDTTDWNQSVIGLTEDGTADRDNSIKIGNWAINDTGAGKGYLIDNLGTNFGFDLGRIYVTGKLRSSGHQLYNPTHADNWEVQWQDDMDVQTIVLTEFGADEDVFVTSSPRSFFVVPAEMDGRSIISYKVYIPTAPEGQDALGDINIDNVSIDSFTITDSTKFVDVVPASPIELTENDVFQVTLSQIGTSVRGKGLQVIAKVR